LPLIATTARNVVAQAELVRVGFVADLVQATGAANASKERYESKLPASTATLAIARSTDGRFRNVAPLTRES
jgi:hypothetical protein